MTQAEWDSMTPGTVIASDRRPSDELWTYVGPSGLAKGRVFIGPDGSPWGWVYQEQWYIVERKAPWWNVRTGEGLSKEFMFQVNWPGPTLKERIALYENARHDKNKFHPTSEAY